MDENELGGRTSRHPFGLARLQSRMQVKNFGPFLFAVEKAGFEVQPSC